MSAVRAATPSAGPADPAAGAAAAAAAAARAVAATVTDPEMPMLTLADLGVLRDVVLEGERVVVTITPTYSGCPAMAAMRDDLVRTLQQRGWPEVEVRVSLSPAWSSDWISEAGRRALREHGMSPPGSAAGAGLGTGSGSGPVPLRLLPRRRALACPRCASAAVELTSEFGPTACTAVYRCTACGEPFQHVKEI